MCFFSQWWTNLCIRGQQVRVRADTDPRARYSMSTQVKHQTRNLQNVCVRSKYCLHSQPVYLHLEFKFSLVLNAPHGLKMTWLLLFMFLESSISDLYQSSSSLWLLLVRRSFLQVEHKMDKSNSALSDIRRLQCLGALTTNHIALFAKLMHVRCYCFFLLLFCCFRSRVRFPSFC